VITLAILQEYENRVYFALDVSCPGFDVTMQGLSCLVIVCPVLVFQEFVGVGIFTFHGSVAKNTPFYEKK
jgi:hypothetical protein